MLLGIHDLHDGSLDKPRFQHVLSVLALSLKVEKQLLLYLLGGAWLLESATNGLRRAIVKRLLIEQHVHVLISLIIVVRRDSLDAAIAQVGVQRLVQSRRARRIVL